MQRVEDARKNAIANHIDNCTFVAGDMMKVFNDAFIENTARLMWSSPIHPGGWRMKMCRTLLRLNPRSIIYVSCNPVTQARDVQWLSEGYRVTQIQTVDMFPQTFHIENG